MEDRWDAVLSGPSLADQSDQVEGKRTMKFASTGTALGITMTAVSYYGL